MMSYVYEPLRELFGEDVDDEEEWTEITIDHTVKDIARDNALQTAENILGSLEKNTKIIQRIVERVQLLNARQKESAEKVQLLNARQTYVEEQIEENALMVTKLNQANSKLKQEFRQLYKKFHPDKIRDLSESEQQKIMERVQLLNARYELLKE